VSSGILLLDNLLYVAHVVMMENQPNTERVVAHMPKALVMTLDDIQHRERIFGRAEVIRLLVKAAVDAGLDKGLFFKSSKMAPK